GVDRTQRDARIRCAGNRGVRDRLFLCGRRVDLAWLKADTTGVGRVLVYIGLGITAIGLLIMIGVPFGRLPGDIMVRRGNFSFYFSLATSIVVSLLLPLLLSWFRR